MSGVLVDTGFLVSLFRPADRLRSCAREWLRSNRQPLLTVAPIIVETCFFLDGGGKERLLAWVGRRAMTVADVPVAAYPDLATVLRKYADREIDFADAALVWLASQSGLRSVLTVDEGDFSVYRLKSGKRFELMEWMG